MTSPIIIIMVSSNYMFGGRVRLLFPCVYNDICSVKMDFHIVMHTRNTLNQKTNFISQTIILATSEVATYFYVDLIDSALHVTSTSNHEISYFLSQ